MGTSGQSDSKDARKNQPQPVVNIGGDVNGNIIVGNSNQIHQAKKTESTGSASRQVEPGKEYGCQFRVVIIAAIVIGCIAITVTSLTPFAGWVRSYLLTNATPTSTKIIISGATDAPTILTEEPSAPVSALPELGKDWQNDCISSQWLVYPSEQLPVDENGCYQQPVWDSISTKDGGFYIFAQPKALTSSEEYGFFAPLPQKGIVTVSLDLDKIDNGQIWFGIFSAPNVHDTDGVLLVAPPGDVKNHAFALKHLLPNNTEKDIVVSKVYNNDSGVYSLGFDLQYGTITAMVEGTPQPPILYPSVTRWLFVGYRAKLFNPIDGTADIQALFTDLVIK
jgi:hypothetical protein